MNILLKLLLVSLLIFNIGYAQNSKTLKIGSDGGFPPYTDIDEHGNLVGFEIELAKAICRQIKRPCEFVQVDFDELFPALAEKKVDVLMAGLSISDKRLQNTSISIPYIESSGRFVKLKSMPFKYSAGALQGKKIGLEVNGVFQDYMQATYSKELEIVPYPNIKEALDALKKQDIDFVIGDAAPLAAEFINPFNSPFEFFGPEIISTSYLGEGQAAYFRKEQKTLAKEFSTAIRKLRTTQEFQKLSKQFFQKDIFPGI